MSSLTCSFSKLLHLLIMSTVALLPETSCVEEPGKESNTAFTIVGMSPVVRGSSLLSNSRSANSLRLLPCRRHPVLRQVGNH